jgi:hypothetical protein
MCWSQLELKKALAQLQASAAEQEKSVIADWTLYSWLKWPFFKTGAGRRVSRGFCRASGGTIGCATLATGRAGQRVWPCCAHLPVKTDLGWDAWLCTMRCRRAWR